MKFAGHNILYLDRRIPLSLDAALVEDPLRLDCFDSDPASQEARRNVQVLLSRFQSARVFATGSACLAALADLQVPTGSVAEKGHDYKSTIVFVDIPAEQERQLRRLSHNSRPTSPAPLSKHTDDREPISLSDLYGYHFLIHLFSQIHSGNMSMTVVPAVVLSGFDVPDPDASQPTRLSLSPDNRSFEIDRITRYLDAGATCVFYGPLTMVHLREAAAQAYRACKEVAKTDNQFLNQAVRQHVSWVGVDEDKPFEYLREAMVSNLLTGICSPEFIADRLRPREVQISEARLEVVADAISQWRFPAHDFSDDELLHAARLMLEHALSMPGIEELKLSSEELTVFLLASRAAYNDFVVYHNFRHVVDVLQALFSLLVAIQAIPPYGTSTAENLTKRSSINSLITPFDAITLLISAVGHDVGHPGVNNAFLVALNAPLAQLYNDRSVLESFHCAAFSQILRRYWPAAFSNTSLRRLMINTVLATDMGLHFKYLSDLDVLQKQLTKDNDSVESWTPKYQSESRDILCGLLIKCADISNVARQFDTARQWAIVLTDEFHSQGAIEQELDMATCLFGGPPERGNFLKLAESQIGFISIFACPLFQAVTKVFPTIQFGVDEMTENLSIWKDAIASEKEQLISESAQNPNRCETSSVTGNLPHVRQQATPPRIATKTSPGEAIQSLITPPPDKSESGVVLGCVTPRPREVSGLSPVASPASPLSSTLFTQVKSHLSKRADKCTEADFSAPSATTEPSIRSPPTTGRAAGDKSAGSMTDDTFPYSHEWSTDERGDGPASSSRKMSQPSLSQRGRSKTQEWSPVGGATAGDCMQPKGEAGESFEPVESDFARRPSRLSFAFWRKRRSSRPGSGTESRASRLGLRSSTRTATGTSSASKP